MTSFVSIIDPGPCHPEWLTVKALSRLQQVDVVLFDDLSFGKTPKFARYAPAFHDENISHSDQSQSYPTIGIRAEQLKGQRGTLPAIIIYGPILEAA